MIVVLCLLYAHAWYTVFLQNGDSGAILTRKGSSTAYYTLESRAAYIDPSEKERERQRCAERCACWHGVTNAKLCKCSWSLFVHV